MATYVAGFTTQTVFLASEAIAHPTADEFTRAPGVLVAVAVRPQRGPAPQ